tara:strand:+ start:75 stop:470 length:396 start_codon:yes stop_codon:yes gene_type:complete
MSEEFKIEIISPEKLVFSDNIIMATIPSYEGDMSVLKKHISIITFLRPGIIKIKKNGGSSEEFFVEDGTVEYFNDILIILSSSAINKKYLTNDFIDKLNKDTENKLSTKDISDHERYVFNQKLDVLKEIRV